MDVERIPAAQLLPAGLTSRLQEEAEEFVTALAVSMPEEASTPILEEFQRLHTLYENGFESSKTHTEELLEAQSARFGSLLNHLRYKLSQAQEELNKSRTASDTEKSLLGSRLVKALAKGDRLEQSRCDTKAEAEEAQRTATDAARGLERAQASLKAVQAALENEQRACADLESALKRAEKERDTAAAREAILADRLAKCENVAEASHQEIAKLQQRRIQMEQELRDAIERNANEASRAKEEVEALRKKLVAEERLRLAAEEREKALAGVQVRVAEMERADEERKAREAEEKARRDELDAAAQAALEAAQQQAADEEARRVALEAKLEDAEVALRMAAAAAAAEAARGAAERRVLGELLGELEATVAAQVRRLGELREEVAALAHELARTMKELEAETEARREAEEARREAEAQKEALQARLAEVEAELGRMVEERAQLEAQLAAAQEQVRAAEEEATRRAVELEKARERAAEAAAAAAAAAVEKAREQAANEERRERELAEARREAEEACARDAEARRWAEAEAARQAAARAEAEEELRHEAAAREGAEREVLELRAALEEARASAGEPKAVPRPPCEEARPPCEEAGCHTDPSGASGSTEKQRRQLEQQLGERTLQMEKAYRGRLRELGSIVHLRDHQVQGAVHLVHALGARLSRACTTLLGLHAHAHALELHIEAIEGSVDPARALQLRARDAAGAAPTRVAFGSGVVPAEEAAHDTATKLPPVDRPVGGVRSSAPPSPSTPPPATTAEVARRRRQAAVRDALGAAPLPALPHVLRSMESRHADEEADTPKDVWFPMGTAVVRPPPPAKPGGQLHKGSLLRRDAPDVHTVPPLPTAAADKMVDVALEAAVAFDQLRLSLEKGLGMGVGPELLAEGLARGLALGAAPLKRGGKHRPAALRASGVAPRRALPTDMRPIDQSPRCEPWAVSSHDEASTGQGGAAGIVAAPPEANDAVNLPAAAPAPAASGLLPKLARPTRTRSMPVLRSTQRDFKPPPVSVMVPSVGDPGGLLEVLGAGELDATSCWMADVTVAERAAPASQVDA